MEINVGQERDWLGKLNIVTQVEYMEGAAPIVDFRKANDSIRICGDFSMVVNDAVPDEYPSPLPDDIIAKLANSTSVL